MWVTDNKRSGIAEGRQLSDKQIVLEHSNALTNSG